MASDLTGRTIAFLATDGVEEVELTRPAEALRAAGAKVVIVSPKSDTIQAMNNDVEPSSKIPVDLEVANATSTDYDGLVLPGGTTSPDKLRMDPTSVQFVRHFVQAGKPIAAICHGPWTLINADGVAGHTLTSWPSLQKDLENAGATWVDETVVHDGKLVTSRNPKDIPAFCEKLIELFAA